MGVPTLNVVFLEKYECVTVTGHVCSILVNDKRLNKFITFSKQGFSNLNEPFHCMWLLCEF